MKGIYMWVNIYNDKKYIGKSLDLAKRKREYKNEIKRGSNRYIIRAMRKYGIDNFNFLILEEFEERENNNFILDREQYWMDYYDTQNKEKGYNILDAKQTPAEVYSIGSLNNKAKLKEADVLNIRKKVYIDNISPAVVYIEYKDIISYEAFSKAIRADTWTNVDTSMIKKIEIKRKNKPKAKLTKKDVLHIRKLYQDGVKVRDIYNEYVGICTKRTIERVVKNETWKDIY